MQNFINLSRRFRDLTYEELEEPEFLASLNDDMYFSAIDWPEILKYPRVLLLAEAGSGKTAEMQEQARLLASENKYAFFIALESLDRESLNSLLSAEEERAFDSWKVDGHSTAFFFLDAVDELKLTQGKFERALSRFSKAVDGLLERIHVVISCRPNDWRPDLDMATVQSKLPIALNQQNTSALSDEVFLAGLRKKEGIQQPEEDTVNVDDVRAVVMLPMSESQIETFSRGLGVKNTAAFIIEIHKQNAWVFARRPLDCSELIATWTTTGQLGTRVRQHEANAIAKLKDDPGRPDTGEFSNVKARLGAERLALALALTRARTIRSPEQSLDAERAESVLDPSEILQNWTESERQALLRRALFAPATYGRIRFHHRSVQEYLAACRLRSLRDNGMSVKALMSILFAECYGVDVVLPSMRPIAAWLALWDEDIRRELMKREPEILLSLGDPEALPLEARAELVRAFAAAYGKGGWRGFNIPIDEVRRLAHPKLKDVIREIWASGTANEDVRELLLELIRQGAIEGCADIAISAAINEKLPPQQRIVGVRALIAFGRLDAVREISDSILNEPSKWPDRIIHSLATDLFPKIIIVNELVSLVKRTREPKNTISGFSWALEQIAQNIDPLSIECVELRNALADLIWRGRNSEQIFYRITSKYDYIASALALLCARQLSLASQVYRDHDLIRACVIANRFGEREAGAREPNEVLKQYFTNDLLMREMSFWIEVEIMDELTPAKDDWDRLFHVEHGCIARQISEMDRAWLEGVLDDKANPKNRAIAIRLLLQLWSQRDRSVAEANLLRKSVAGDHDLIEAINKYTAPPKPNAEIEKMEQDRLKRQAVEKEREQKRIEGWLKWREELLADPKKAFSSANIMQTMSNIYKWLKAHKKSNSRYSVWDMDALTNAFGSDIALQAFKAFKTYWRSEMPIIWSQRSLEERNSTLLSWVYGLCGISAESAIPGWARKLTREEAQVAAAYATVELNGFPPWLVDIVDEHPGDVESVLGAELDTELRKCAEYQYLPVLQDLSYADMRVKKLLAPHLIKGLSVWDEFFIDEEAGRHSLYHLDQVIRILYEASSHEIRSSVTSICESRFVTDPNGQLSFTWLRGLFLFEPVRGIQAFEKGLSAIDEPDRAERAINIFASLFGDRNNILLDIKNVSKRAVLLGRLIRCAYKYIRSEDDLVHEGSYQPNTRDDAETARSFLLSSLVDTPGPEARNVILELSSEPLFSHLPDRLRLLARKRAANDAEFEPFSPSDITALEDRLETPPHNRDSLFNLMIDRLDDLEHDIAHDDFTDRRTLRTIKDESEMQRTIARRLKDKARGAYIVTREDEVADRKRTDIRLASTHGDQKAAIEIKIADNNWTMKDLERALRNQLVGQYLRHESSKTGCLLLTYNGTKKYWVHPETRKHVGFLDVIGYVECIAKKIEDEMNYEVRLSVRGLDLTDPVLAPAHS